ncbi:MAG: GNAT family N-acetyltransferase [Rhizobiaceae bacterium]|nr:GNAT family N-acetyltransferase [Rhizobiaceae bacterium]
MTTAIWREEAIGRQHNREGFDCADGDLNDFLRRYARQSHDLGAAKTFVAIDVADNKTILGFYSLAPTSLDYHQTPEAVRRRLPRHDVPGFKLARIAVGLSMQGQGLGGQLLLSAGRRCLQVAAQVGGMMLVIDARNDRAADWYRKYGAIPLADVGHTLVLPLATIEMALREVGQF